MARDSSRQKQLIIYMQADLLALPFGWNCRFLPQTKMASDMLLSLTVPLFLEVPCPPHRPKSLKGGVFVIVGGRQRQQEGLSVVYSVWSRVVNEIGV